MELVSLHTLARTEEGRPLWLTYKLLCHQGRYGILCYLEGLGSKGQWQQVHFWFLHNLTYVFPPIY